MTNISRRNVLRMWWSTDPALVGYPDSAAQRDRAFALLLSSTPFRGTPRQIVTEIERVRRNIGSAYCRFEFRTADGRSVSRDEIHDLFIETEPRRRG